MRIRVADYIACFLSEYGLKDVFTVTGGGAMHMNDAFGHHENLHCIYNHHEQAAAMAAEAYARINNQIALVCVTSGPGATNAITGVIGGWMDSIPMLVISGQARYATTVYASNLNLRTRGIQEFDIIGSVQNMTKYCELVVDPKNIRYCLEKAIYLAKSGRPGPCWLDIPLDVQGATIDTEELPSYTPDIVNYTQISDLIIKKIISRITASKRPILYLGNGIRIAGCHTEMLRLVEKMNIPVVTGMSSVDAISSDHRLFVGRCGVTGDRPGNFAIQNCDLLISFGSRLSFNQTGFNYQSWARAAFKIINDIDNCELEKDSILADIKICCNVAELINRIDGNLSEAIEEKFDWTTRCREWKVKYPIVLPHHFIDPKPNIYVFYRKLTEKLTMNDCLVASVGMSRIVGSQVSQITEGMRFITNASTASMGYCLPAAIGVSVATKGEKRIVLVTGDGSIQMNLQELQTIIQNRFPIKIFVMNNKGYQSIRVTQKSYFKNSLVGVGTDSGDISFPDLGRIANAYGFDFLRCSSSNDVDACIDWALNHKESCICEMMLSKNQLVEPKAASKRMGNGQMISAPLEDMMPFLPEEELKANMFIPLIHANAE